MTKSYPPSAALAASAHINADGYARMYAASIADPEAFWGEQGRRVDWIKPYTRVKDTSFELGKVAIEWFGDGTLNISANCSNQRAGRRAQ